MFVCMYGKIADRLVHWGVVKYIHIIVYTRPKQPSNHNNLPNNTWPKLPLHTEPEAPPNQMAEPRQKHLSRRWWKC